MATLTPRASFFVSSQRIPVKQTVSMVALVGQPSGWPVTIGAGFSPPPASPPLMSVRTLTVTS
ncbi:hypothetical protein AE457_003387 [Salmonella enterica subsp. enterica serovar Amsterdam]|uniref:Ash family protein n=2 Tax=Enterobacteriaceae TaxID=543 RepID=A0A5V3WF70_SALER|nr:hypothetical protein [Salmonella enterica subsp. enterica serovar Amsterdam]EAM5214549.1 hypothetical protein [Salmonella enterica]EBW7491636.1 hypothetical protein [Salmonella enterica subsp. enterica serovar Enteritidis]ECC3635457.1 hypothetical protein [Salmonella enterica subsp. enterica]ECR4402642.1 hypothetical protein [Salmonella enterica subsp. enterica serovar Ona]EDE1996075.1 hypothetical protein [Salmonella enterica subsp. enterica serovar Hissar]EDZ3587979.1 hypothetical protei